MANARAVFTSAMVRLSPFRTRRHRLPRQLPPRLIEMEYARELIRIVNTVRILLKPLIDESPRLVASSELDRRFDAGETRRIKKLIEQAASRLKDAITPTKVIELAKKFAGRTSVHQRIQLARQTRAALGINLLASDTKLSALTEGFVAENVALINDIPKKLIADVEGVVTRAVTTGRRSGDLAKELSKKFGFAKNRARLIARDQIGKFHGQLNVIRQQELGVEEFVWQTAGDKRVRPTHRNLDGSVFRFKNPPPEGLPGEPIACRCWPEPVFTDILKGV